MTLYPCPICRQDPEVSERAKGWTAFCWCHSEIARTWPDLRHQWNDLYCGGDPA